jgi:Tfp pilus assembly protein PilE
MSIVELMVVVVIIGILAGISVVSYRHYIARARLSEPTAMLAELSAKEQLYYLATGLYIEAHRDTQASTSTNENPSEFYPTDASTYFDSARTPVALGTLPASWQILGIRPRWRALYCTYLVNAGPAGATLPGVIGPTLWTASPNVPWFYALGACNLSGPSGWPNNVTVLALTNDSPAIQTTDEKE